MKMTKTQIWDKVQVEIKSLKLGKKEDTVLEALSFLQPGITTSKKINDEGYVYCNYYDRYMPADSFNTNSKGKYKANSVAAEKVIRRIKVNKKNIERQLMESFKRKDITGEMLENSFNELDNFFNDTFDTVEDVPTVANFFGLN